MPLVAGRPADTNQLADVVSLMQAMFGLDEEHAKTVIYWALATHGLSKLGKFPILVIYGPYGTGKTSILRALQQLAKDPGFLDGKLTKAALRDFLAKEGKVTTLIDEADDIHEEFLVNSYSRQSSEQVVKRLDKIGWHDVVIDAFGAVAVNRRKPLKDAAILSRAVIVTTRRTKVIPFKPVAFGEHYGTIEALAKDIAWENADTDQGDRIADTWEPLLFVARYLEDGEWSEHALAEIEVAQDALRMGQGEEPTEAVFGALFALALGNGAGGKLPEARQRVPLGDVTRQIQDDQQELTSWQVGDILRRMGFETKKAGGKMYVYTGGSAKLTKVGQELNIEDEWLEEAA